MTKYIITTANVFIPAEIRYTNISSTYLPADVLNKLLKVFGKDSTLVAGVDVYGKHAYRALKEVKNKNKYINDCKTKFRNTLKLWGIEPDLYIDSDNDKMNEFVEYSIKNLQNKGLIEKVDDPTFYCRDCNEELSKSECNITSKEENRLKKYDKLDDFINEDIECRLCGGQNVEIRMEHQWELKLPRTSFLTSLIEQQDQASNVCQNMQGIYDNNFNTWVFTRNNYGRVMPIDKDKRIYLWYDSLISKLLPLTNNPENVSNDLKESEYFCYFGKNILPYYSLIMPTIFKYGFNAEQMNIKYEARGFCLTQENDASILSQDVYTPEELSRVRLFVLSRVPDKIKDYKLTEDNYKQFLSGTYKNLIKYFHRTSPILSGAIIDFNSDEYRIIENHVLNGRVNKVVSTIEQWAIDDLKEIGKNTYDIKKVKNRHAIITKVIGAIAPNMIKELNYTNKISQVNQAILEKKYDHSK
ncbi:MAG: class I tRNA ligase family protein [Alphaproteobacteria bacterium]|nr:class I tRNA ligase family protein [Alphaproteobacteria bacterium]